MLHGKVMTIYKSEEGQILPVMAIAMSLVIIALLGIAIDVGYLYRQKRMVQTAADAAAIAAAGQYATGFNTGYQSVASTAALQQPGLISSGANKATVLATLGTVASKQMMTVSVTQPTSTYFMRWENLNLVSVSATASALFTAPANSGCIQAQEATPVSATGFPLYQGAGSGGIMSGNSGGSPDIVAIGCKICSNTNITGFSNGPGIKGDGVESAATVSGNVTTTGTAIQSNGAACTDPFAATIAAPAPSTYSSCQAFPWASNPNGGQAGVLSPNPNGPAYCNFTTTKLASLTLSSGLYIFAQSFNLGGGVSVTGTGVTIYFAPGTDLNGGSGGSQYGFDNGTSMNITAPTSGPYAGIAIWDGTTTPNAPDTFTLNGGSSTQINGAIYAPNTNLVIGNGSSGFVLNSCVLVGTLSVGGSGNLTVNSTTPCGGSGGGGAVSVNIAQ